MFTDYRLLLQVRLEGNAIMISGFNQHTSIAGNHIAYTGDSAIAGWGCVCSRRR